MDGTKTSLLLAALGSELASVRHGIEGLSSLVSAHVRNAGPHERAQALRDGQAIDVLAQRLDALCIFTHALAGGVPLRDALATVHLADLADRLTVCLFATAATQGDPEAAGELVLFD